MRGLILLVTVALAAGCGREPSFDERYSNAAQSIAGRANELDAELNQSGESSRSETNASRASSASRSIRSREGP
jgi:hypothetical protein